MSRSVCLLVLSLAVVSTIARAFDSTEIRLLDDQFDDGKRALGPTRGKRGAAPLIRFGRSAADDADEDDFDRPVRTESGMPLIRFGKRAQAPLIRFGRAQAPLIRFGKRAAAQSPLIRFGRAQAPLIRFGKRSDDESRYDA